MSDIPSRRKFLASVGVGSAMAGLAGLSGAQEPPKIPGFESQARDPHAKKKWVPGSDRKLRVGIVGYGTCRFGAAFGFQDHPNVDVVAVSDLFPDRCAALAKVCRCDKTYPSLEDMAKDRNIEAIFLATDAPSHARQAINVMQHGKHVASAVPAVWGSLEDAQRLFEAVKKTGMTYMMMETSCYRPDNYAMRQVYQAGGFGKLIYSEGEYYHFHSRQIGSYKDWRVGSIPLWYPTHSTAYYVGVTGKPFTSVSCTGFTANIGTYPTGNNAYQNHFTDQIALFQTAEGGTSRMLMCKGIQGKVVETGRVFGERGSMENTQYHGLLKSLPDLERPALPPQVQPGGHGGSHGQLCNEFVQAIIQERRPLVDVVMALNMTVCGIVAAQSALRDGERLPVPTYQW